MKNLILLGFVLISVFIFGQTAQKYQVQLGSEESSVFKVEKENLKSFLNQKLKMKNLNNNGTIKVDNFTIKVPKSMPKVFVGDQITQETIDFISMAKPGQIVTIYDFTPEGNAIPEPHETNIIIIKIQ